MVREYRVFGPLAHLATRPNVPQTVVRYGRGAPILQSIMFVIYVLQDKNGKLYKGQTDNLERRLREHQSGKVTTTSKMEDCRLVYTETVVTRREALKKEKYFKTAAGRRFLKKVIILGP